MGVLLLAGVVATQLGYVQFRTSFQHGGAPPSSERAALVSLLHGARAVPAGQHSKGSVAGQWKVSVGSMTGLTLDLKQDGTAVTGTFSNPHGDLAVKGEFANGALAIATVGSDPAFDLKGTLKENGTLEGTLVSGSTEMTWTAERAGGHE